MQTRQARAELTAYTLHLRKRTIPAKAVLHDFRDIGCILLSYMLRISAWMHSLQAGTTPLTDTQSKSSTDSTSSGTDTSASFPVSASVQPFKSGILTAPTPKFRVGA